MAAHTGAPLMRAMLLEFPADPACDTLDRQYMLGESLLVAPVFSYDGSVSYYLPEGRWTNLLTGEPVEGGRWLRETHGALSMPLLVRPNTVLALGANAARPDYDYADGVTLQVYELAEGGETLVEIPTLDGGVACEFAVQRAARTITITRRGDAAGGGRALLVGVRGADVAGGTAEAGAQGLLLTPDAGASDLRVELP
ncbi:hypothetical protein SE17_23710 [Kouleothrix aurantiaca]|uniref:Glycosyl hydrolase family 31 C-terminal domain-containing protein n=1 Tax=Kouleothrix aurantiaca TaxID=186479 RepID=A0A0P9F398_9CHLR|nr:hypothetical protein SE17_23710 [Kouleothrix aurantiaca]